MLCCSRAHIPRSVGKDSSNSTPNARDPLHLVQSHSFLQNSQFALTGRSGAGGTGPESTAGAELIVGSWNALAGVLAVEYLQQADAASIAALAGELVIARLSATPGSSHLCNAATQTMCILETRPILSVMLDCGTVSLNTVWVRTRKSLQPLHCAHVK